MKRVFSGLPIGVCASVLLYSVAAAATYTLSTPGDALIGAPQEVRVQAAETLLDIARRFDLGINELAAANPGLDPWLPPPGARVIVPTQFLLPETPHEGVVVNLPEMRLYYYPPARPGQPQQVITHPIGIGSEGRAIPAGLTKVVGKTADPPWVVPDSIRAEHAAEGETLPKVVPPGPDNPLGRYALRLGFGSFLIHGTNRPYSIGMRVSHGCLRMYPEAIETFFPLVAVDTPVRIVDQPYKAGWHGGKLYLEAHAPIVEAGHSPKTNLTPVVAAIIAVNDQRLDDVAWQQAVAVATALDGTPTVVWSGGGEPAIPRVAPQPALALPLLKGWVYQIGAFREPGRVERVASMIRGLDLPVLANMAGTGHPCRVGVGPFPDKDSAQTTGTRVEKEAGLQGMLVPAERYNAGLACVP